MLTMRLLTGVVMAFGAVYLIRLVWTKWLKDYLQKEEILKNEDTESEQQP